MPEEQITTESKECKVCGALKPIADFRALNKTCVECRKPKTRRSIVDRLMARRLITESGCWEWTGARSPGGYGKMSYVFPGEKREHKVHRVAAHLFLGYDLANPLRVLHRCDNRPCFNPEHLFLGTLSDNSRDMVAKNRHRPVRNIGYKITKQQAVAIRESRRLGREEAAAYGVSEALVRLIRKGEAWKYA